MFGTITGTLTNNTGINVNAKVSFEGRDQTVEINSGETGTYKLIGINTTAQTAESGLVTVSDATGQNKFLTQQTNITTTQATTPPGEIILDFTLTNTKHTITIDNYDDIDALGAEAIVSYEVQSYPSGTKVVQLDKSKTYSLAAGTNVQLGSKPSKLWFSYTNTLTVAVDSFTLENDVNLTLHLPTYT